MARLINLGTIETFETEVVNRTLTQCRKCNGQGRLIGLGRLPDNGICYRCNGSGEDPRPHTITEEVTRKSSNQLLCYDFAEFESFEEVLAAHQRRKELEDKAVEEGDFFKLFEIERDH